MLESMDVLDLSATARARFWSKVIRGEGAGACWIWCGAIGSDGYGRFWLNDPSEPQAQRVMRAHRYAMATVLGQDVPAGNLVTHLCDNPLCVRAEPGDAGHLFLGNHAENMAERQRRGRGNLHNEFYIPRSRAERARDARIIRAHTLEHGYSQELIDEVMRMTRPANQGMLF